MAESVWLWSKTAANNATADGGIVWSELQLPSTVNNSARGMMAAVAKMRDDMGGQLTLGGGTTAYTLTTNQVLGTLADGVRIVAVVNSTNTAASTLNVDSLGAKAIRKVLASGEAAIAAGDMVAAQHAVFQYDASANSAAGAWILLNPANPGVARRVATTVSRTMTVADAGITLASDEDTGAADLTHTLTLAADVVAGTRVKIRKKGKIKFTHIDASGSDRLGDDGPQFAISNITSSSGTLITLAEQRVISTGRKVLVSGVASPLDSLNGVHTWVRSEAGSSPQTTGRLQGVAYPGGVYVGASDFVTLINTRITLKVQGEWVELESDGVSRWDIVGEGTGRYSTDRDFLRGPWLSYTGGQLNPGTLPFKDDGYSGLYRRSYTRTLVLNEVADPPEVQGQHTALATGSYPDGDGDGTGDTAVPSGEGLLSMWGSAWNGSSFLTRAIDIAIENAEDASTGAGGQLTISANRIGDVAGVVSQIIVKEQSTALAGGYNASAGKLTATITDSNTTLPNRPALFIRHLATTLTAPIIDVRGPATGPTYKFIRFSSNDGSDPEFTVDQAGNILHDGTIGTPAADVAEYSVPWWDKNPRKRDRRGMTVVQVRADDPDAVVWPGDRGHARSVIRLFDAMPPGTPREAIWAPVSSRPMITGGAWPLHWKGKFATDALGNVEWEEAEAVSFTEYQIWNKAKLLDEPLIKHEEVAVHAFFLDRATPEQLASMPADSKETLEDVKAMVRAAVNADRSLYRGSSRLRWVSPPVRAMTRRKKWSGKFRPEEDYVPRGDRAEWFTAAIAKVGDVWVRKDQALHPLWTVLEETDDAVLVSVMDQRRR